MALEEFGSTKMRGSVDRIKGTIENAKLATPPSTGAQPSPPKRLTAEARYRKARNIRIIAATINGSVLVGLALLVWKLSSNTSATSNSPVLSASVVASSAPSAEVVPSSGPVPLVVMPFENLTGDAAWNGLSLSTPDAVREGLRSMADIRLVDGSGAALEHGGLRLKGRIKKIGNGLQLVADVESVNVLNETSHGEPVSVEASGAEPERAFEALRQGVVDEVRLMSRLWDRHRRAVVGTQSEVARAKLLQFYVMVGPVAQRTHVDAGMDLLDAALVADPNYVPAIVERAYLRTVGGKGSMVERVNLAKTELDKAAQTAPTDATVAVMRCRVAQLATKAAERPTDALLTEARGACRDALQVAPSSAYVHIALARMHDLACEDDEAIRLLEQSLDLDRALWGRSLVQLINLTLQSGQVDIADRMSAKLVALQDNEERLGDHAFSRRAGAPPVSDAHSLRGAVLLRRGLVEEARGEFERVLASNKAGSGAKLQEAAALRGVLRAVQSQGKRLSPEHERRLADLEAGFRANAKDSPEEIVFVAEMYADVDAKVAVDWFDRTATPSSCTEAFQRALVYRAAERRDAAKKILNFCKPIEQWEKSCMASVRTLVSE